ncbi:MAG: hypothetical protein JWL90_377, partial [Chthoniobacteraceae bacterium]|nr:hypothetical protein [Chthoniobacteraceae bacterium]
MKVPPAFQLTRFQVLCLVFALLFGNGATAQGAATLVVEDSAGTPLVIIGSVATWGYHAHAEAMPPAGLTDVEAIAVGGFQTLAVRSDGSVVAWGEQTTVPAGLINVKAVTQGTVHSVALKRDGTVVAWGSNNGGQTDVPPGLSGIQAVSAGLSHTLALKNDGTVIGWGNNYFGQLDVPPGVSGMTAIAVGDSHSVALTSNGTVVAWGANNAGQSTVPGGLSNVKAVCAGAYHTVALKQDGTVVAWGSNMFGATTLPAGLSDVIAIAAGGYVSVALKRDGTVVAWGNNDHGQRIIPPALSGAQAIAAGAFHIAALLRSTAPMSFGNQNVAGGPLIKTFTLKNSGTEPLSIQGASIEGGNSGDFILDAKGLPATLPSGGQTTLSVAFLPTNSGNRITRLRVLSNDGTVPAYDIPLNGIGVDTAAPIIAPHADVVVEAENAQETMVAYSAAIVTDDSSSRPTIRYSRNSGTVFPFGQTAVIITATDAAGNVGTSSFNVLVRDTKPPTISDHSDISTNATTPQGTFVEYTPVTVFDSVTLKPAIVYSMPSGSLFPVGTTTVTITATDDAGNVATSRFLVTIRDATAPVIAPHANVTAEATSAAGAVVSYTAASAVDEIDGNVTAGYSQNSGTLFPIGVTTVTIFASDRYKNTSSSSFTVTVADTKPPVIAAHADVLV